MNIIIFGAGKIGHKFIQSKCFSQLAGNHIYFYDNNKNLPKVIEGIERLDDINDKVDNTDIIITCAAWISVFRECVSRGYEKIRIYDVQRDEILTIKEYSRLNLSYYENMECARYQIEKDKKVLQNREKFLKTNDLFGSITEVAIMLSNLCNYATIHKKCPASCIKRKQIMPSKVVYKILDELAACQFEGTICFHVYNEPLIDPRLFLFIQYAKNNIPLSKVRIYSNGYYLDNVMAEELYDIGTDILVTTGYGKDEYERLLNLDVKTAFSVLYGNLDDRIDYYTKRNSTHVVSNGMCDTYIYQVPIYADGDIGTCCLDYMHPYGLGNIIHDSLEKCLNNGRVVDFQNKLLQGDRTTFTICTNCFWKR